MKCPLCSTPMDTTSGWVSEQGLRCTGCGVALYLGGHLQQGQVLLSGRPTTTTPTRALHIDPALSTHGSPAICGRARVHRVASHPVSYLWSTTTRSGWQVTCSCGRMVGLPMATWQQAMARAVQWSARCHTETTLAHDTSLTHVTTWRARNDHDGALAFSDGAT